VVTKNPAKLRYVKNNLRRAMKLVGQYDLDVILKKVSVPITGSRDPKNIVDPSYLERIAQEGALSAFNIVKHPCVVIAVGLYIPALGNYPGSDLQTLMDIPDVGNEAILDMMRHKKNRDALLVQSLAFVGYTDMPKPSSSHLECIVTRKEQGKDKDRHWLDVWKILKPKDKDKTLAAMSDKEWEQWRRERVDSGQSLIVDFWKRLYDNLEADPDYLPSEIELLRKKEADELPEP
jgi:XTP/dITP diphosphohydrolase